MVLYTKPKNLLLETPSLGYFIFEWNIFTQIGKEGPSFILDSGRCWSVWIQDIFTTSKTLLQIYNPEYKIRITVICG